jgi:hypothetical protein
MSQNKCIVRSQKAIQAAFIDLMTKKAFGEITTTDIIDVSGYSRGTFYTHYTDKYDLEDKIMENEITNFVEIIVGTIKHRKRIVIKPGIYEPVYLLFQHIKDNRALYRLILKEKISGYTLDNFIDTVNARCKQAVDVETNNWPDGLSRDFYFYVNTYKYMIYIKYWEMHDFEPSAKDMAKQVTYMFNMEKVKSVYSKQA